MKRNIFLFVLLISSFFLCCNSTVGRSDEKVNNMSSVSIDSLGDKLQEIEFKEYNFKIGYPNGWIKVNEGEALFVCKMNCSNKGGFCPNIVLNVVQKKEDASLKDYAVFFQRKLQSEFKDLQIVNLSPGIVNGFESITIDYKMMVNDTHLGATTSIIDIGRYILFVNCMGENEPEGKYVEYRKLFDGVIKSVKKV